MAKSTKSTALCQELELGEMSCFTKFKAFQCAVGRTTWSHWERCSAVLDLNWMKRSIELIFAYI